MQDSLPKHIKVAFKLFNRCITRYNGIFIDKKFLHPGRGAGQILPLSAALPSSDRFIPHLAFCLQSKCCNCCPCGKEGGGNFLHEGEGFGAVAVDADGIGLQGYGAAVVGLYGTLRRHLQDPRNGGILALDHCAGSAAWHKAAVGPVAAVCKYLAGNGQSDGVCGLDHLAAGECQ